MATRADLTGQYLGETTQKTKTIIQEAEGNTLLIDEVSSLIGDRKDTYGKEAANALMDSVSGTDSGSGTDTGCLIIAGYPSGIENFLATNEGWNRRVTHRIKFKDLDAKEIALVSINKVKAEGINIEDEAKVLDTIASILTELGTDKLSQYNAGLAVKIASLVKINRQRRLCTDVLTKNISQIELTVAKTVDFQKSLTQLNI